MAPHSLTDFEIQNYYQNEPKFNGVKKKFTYSDGVHVINLGEYKSIGTHLIALYENGNNIPYFDSFGVEHIPKEIKEFMEKKNIITIIYRMQACDSIMYEYFCIGFIDLFTGYKKNDKIILKYFQ